MSAASLLRKAMIDRLSRTESVRPRNGPWFSISTSSPSAKPTSRSFASSSIVALDPAHARDAAEGQFVQFHAATLVRITLNYNAAKATAAAGN